MRLRHTNKRNSQKNIRFSVIFPFLRPISTTNDNNECNSRRNEKTKRKATQKKKENLKKRIFSNQRTYKYVILEHDFKANYFFAYFSFLCSIYHQHPSSSCTSCSSSFIIIITIIIS